MNETPNGKTAAEQWNGAIAAKLQLGMSRAAAVAAVSRENPGLRERYVDDHNAAHGRPRRRLEQ